MINFIGGEAMPLQLSESRGFSFDIDDLEALISNRTRMIILNSPQNPTGGVLPRETLQGIADLAIKHDLVVLADEIYSDIALRGHAPQHPASSPACWSARSCSTASPRPTP